MASTSIHTKRLELVPATPDSTRAALGGRERLQASLSAVVPATWPHEYLDAPALQFMLERLEQSPMEAGWWLHFVILKDSPSGRIVIGSAGYKGRPSQGIVEVGYGIVSDHRRCGYAFEAVEGLLERAFSLASVEHVIAETLPELVPSIGVLRKAGFREAGAGSEAGVLRFELTRASYDSRG